jgi:hypothetical protein
VFVNTDGRVVVQSASEAASSAASQSASALDSLTTITTIAGYQQDVDGPASRDGQRRSSDSLRTSRPFSTGMLRPGS